MTAEMERVFPASRPRGSGSGTATMARIRLGILLHDTRIALGVAAIALALTAGAAAIAVLVLAVLGMTAAWGRGARRGHPFAFPAAAVLVSATALAGCGSGTSDRPATSPAGPPAARIVPRAPLDGIPAGVPQFTVGAVRGDGDHVHRPNARTVRVGVEDDGVDRTEDVFEGRIDVRGATLAWWQPHIGLDPANGAPSRIYAVDTGKTTSRPRSARCSRPTSPRWSSCPTRACPSRSASGYRTRSLALQPALSGCGAAAAVGSTVHSTSEAIATAVQDAIEEPVSVIIQERGYLIVFARERGTLSPRDCWLAAFLDGAVVSSKDRRAAP